MEPSTPQRATLQRPTLLPGLRRLWRTPHTLQLGADPARAVVLELANPAVAKLLDLLDGAHSERSVLAHAARHGVSDADAGTLLDTLRAAGLVVGAQALLPAHLPPPIRRRLTTEAAALALRRTSSRTGARTSQPARATPAQILRHRAAARVMVVGRGRLGAGVAIALAHAGVGQVSPALEGVVEPADTISGLLAADLGRPRSAAVADAIQRTVPGTDTRPIRRGEASFVVQAGIPGPARLHAATYARYRLAHLTATVRDGTAVVGPLVPPAGCPCLNCVDLHRTDRDPAWPALAAQLATAAPTEPCTAPTVLAATAFAAAEVLAYLDSRVAGNTVPGPETLGATVEIESPGRHRRRTWPPHPECDCSRRVRRRR
jgi:hypothetical protein